VAALYALVEPVYFACDLAGNRTLMQDEWGPTYWTYDALGRPTSRHDPQPALWAWTRPRRTSPMVSAERAVWRVQARPREATKRRMNEPDRFVSKPG
jgi:YD repeat-containing protein